MTQQVVLPTQNCDPREEKNCRSHETKLGSYMLVLFVRASKSCRRADAHLQKKWRICAKFVLFNAKQEKGPFYDLGKILQKNLMLYMFMAF